MLVDAQSGRSCCAVDVRVFLLPCCSLLSLVHAVASLNKLLTFQYHRSWSTLSLNQHASKLQVSSHGTNTSFNPATFNLDSVAALAIADNWEHPEYYGAISGRMATMFCSSSDHVVKYPHAAMTKTSNNKEMRLWQGMMSVAWNNENAFCNSVCKATAWRSAL